jgi:hypothetical protein
LAWFLLSTGRTLCCDHLPGDLIFVFTPPHTVGPLASIPVHRPGRLTVVALDDASVVGRVATQCIGPSNSGYAASGNDNSRDHKVT